MLLPALRPSTMSRFMRPPDVRSGPIGASSFPGARRVDDGRDSCASSGERVGKDRVSVRRRAGALRQWRARATLRNPSRRPSTLA